MFHSLIRLSEDNLFKGEEVESLYKRKKIDRRMMNDEYVRRLRLSLLKEGCIGEGFSPPR